MSRRQERLASMFQKEISQIIMRELADPRIHMAPSVTRVKVAEDLATADVFVSIMGTPGQQTAALNALKHAAGMMRTKLAKTLSIRQMPLLRFHIDEQLKKELEMLELLHKLEQERKADAIARGEIEPDPIEDDDIEEEEAPETLSAQETPERKPVTDSHEERH